MPERTQEAPTALLDPAPIDAGLLEQLAPGSIARVRGRVHDLAVGNRQGAVFAVTDLCLCCSHSLSQGTWTDGLLTCPHCGWQYDVECGAVAGLPALRIETHRVRIEGGHIFVEAQSCDASRRSP
jgi:nitrite reductase/ring-hydroxylating ferredoxin subunit